MLRRSLLRFAALALGAGLLLPAAAHAEVTIKMATLAPEGTSWYKAIRAIADRWDAASKGEVKVKIYAGGVVGNETATVRKMRIGQLHAAAITNVGLQDIESSPSVTQTPLLIRSYEELDYVMGKMSAQFEQRIADKGFIVLTWGDAGLLKMFTKTPLTDQATAGEYKTFTPEGDPDTAEAYRAAGFSPVVLAATDVLPSLQSGLINAFPSTALGALSQQWFALAPNMMDFVWAPLVGATVITKDAWDSIPAQYHEEFMRIAREEGAAIQAEIRRQDSKSVDVMKKYGLQVHTPDAAAREKWMGTAPAIWAIVRGRVVEEEVFDEAERHVQDFRRGK